jgi:hypothetical protein
MPRDHFSGPESGRLNLSAQDDGGRVVEVVEPDLKRPRQPSLYEVPLLTFDKRG